MNWFINFTYGDPLIKMTETWKWSYVCIKIRLDNWHETTILLCGIIIICLIKTCIKIKFWITAMFEAKLYQFLINSTVVSVQKYETFFVMLTHDLTWNWQECTLNVFKPSLSQFPEYHVQLHHKPLVDYTRQVHGAAGARCVVPPLAPDWPPQLPPKK